MYPNCIKTTMSGTKHRVFKRPKDLQNVVACTGRVLGRSSQVPQAAQWMCEEWSWWTPAWSRSWCWCWWVPGFVPAGSVRCQCWVWGFFVRTVQTEHVCFINGPALEQSWLDSTSVHTHHSTLRPQRVQIDLTLQKDMQRQKWQQNK